MTSEQKIDQQIKAALAKYRQMQPIRDELDDAIDRLVAKLTEQDKLLEVMAGRLEFLAEQSNMAEYARNGLAQYQSYLAGRE